MRYASSFKQPTLKEQALIKRTVKALIKKYGNCRQAAIRLGISPNHMYQLRDGYKTNPGDAILSKLGLRRVTYIEEK